MPKTLGRGLYGMVDLPAPPALSGASPSFESLKQAARRIYEPLFAAAIPVVQLRMKGAGAAAMLAVMDELCESRPPGTLLVVNDRLDVALAAGADGVHLGQDDLPLAAARRIAVGCGKPELLIGISTHDEAQAAAALRGGADYIAFGPVYTTSSKANPDLVVGLERLSALCRGSTRPVVAIGGITLDSAPAIAAAGAHCAAIISAVNSSSDIRAAAAQVQALFAGPR